MILISTIFFLTSNYLNFSFSFFFFLEITVGWCKYFERHKYIVTTKDRDLYVICIIDMSSINCTRIIPLLPLKYPQENTWRHSRCYIIGVSRDTWALGFGGSLITWLLPNAIGSGDNMTSHILLLWKFVAKELNYFLYIRG